MFNKLKQFQDLKKKAGTLQAALAQEVVEGSGGWGKVKIKINGNQHVTEIMIDPGLMEQREKLQDAVKEAINDALQKIQKVMAGKLQDMGGMDLAKDFGDMLKK